MDKIQLPFNKCSQMMSNCPPEETFLHPSRIELSREALKNNLRFLRAHAQKGVRISSVIKGNAYGHGIAEFLPLAENAGIDHFSVFSADEASTALSHKKNDETSVMILRSEEHTSELQSRGHLVCRLLLEKKK